MVRSFINIMLITIGHFLPNQSPARLKIAGLAERRSNVRVAAVVMLLLHSPYSSANLQLARMPLTIGSAGVLTFPSSAILIIVTRWDEYSVRFISK
jgi:hypothetical protein